VTVALVAQPGRFGGDERGERDRSFLVRRAYAEAVHRAGGRLVALPPIADRLDDLVGVLDRMDGLLLHGGGDVDPVRYGAGYVHAEVAGVRFEHDEFELAAVRAALALDRPILAVCRGHQVLNVALGGTLHQHLPDTATTVPHRDAYHGVTVVGGTLLAEVLGGDHVVGHSWHHQAVDRLGAGLVVSARADDGTIEAIELPGRWVLGVQWHPEDSAAHDPANQQLFDRFVAACRR
jgi:putative glutamine amidotransferase